MKKISGFITANYLLFAGIFFALIIFSAFSLNWVKVENDVSVYLSDDMESKQGNSIMNEEFITYATVDVMVEDISRKQAAELADTLRARDGVIMVTYDEDSSYKDNSALFSVSFDGPPTDESVREAYDSLLDSLSTYNFASYTESFKDLSVDLAEEMSEIVLIVVFVVIVILLLATTSYMEIPVLLLTFAAATMIHLGTNFLLGTISFVSNSISIVMQLALSVDYAIIFCNRYKEEHKDKSVRAAVRSALSLSIPEIAASSLTTVAGLLSMTFMQFRLGFDLGVCLIKAILISLLTVFCFMPAMLILFGKLMDKTKHRSFIPRITFFGKFAFRLRYLIAPVFVLVVVFSSLSFSRVNYAYTVDLVESIRKSETTLSRNRILERFGENKMIPLMVPSGDFEKEKALITELSECEEINSVLGLATIDAVNGYVLGDMINYQDLMKIADIDETIAQALFAYHAAGEGDYSEGIDFENYRVPLIDLLFTICDVAENGKVELPEDRIGEIQELSPQLQMAKDQLLGKDYSRIILYVNLPEQGEDTFLFLDRIHLIAGQYYPDNVYLTGMSVAARDFNNTFANDSNTVSILSLLLVMVILLFTFRSVIMPLLLILVIQGSIWINFATSVWAGTNIYFMWYLIVSAVQMGANIDYAIVISSRYNALRAEDVPRREAMIESLSLAFPTVITSGSLMTIAGLLIGFLVSSPDVSGIGLYTGTGTLITIVLVFFALPAVLLLGDSLILKTTLAIRPKESGSAGKDSSAALRVVACILLAVSAIFTLIVLPANKRSSDRELELSLKQCEEQLASIAELKELNEALERSADKFDQTKMEYAEEYVTDQVGREQLDAGEAQYNEGKALLDSKEAEYAASYKLYEEGLKKYQQGKQQMIAGEVAYQKGKAEYEAALAEYNAGLEKYNAGLAQYEEGKKKYDDSLKLYNEGKARYDAGVWEYNQAKTKYDLAKTALDAVGQVYNLVMPAYNDYLSLENQYNQAVAEGDRVKAAFLQGRMVVGKAAFETHLIGFSSVSELIAKHAASKQELADAEVELENARQQLEAGKAELAAGEAELAAGKAELEAGEAELAAAKKILDDGKLQLEAAEKELAAGERELQSGKQELLRGEVELAEAQEKLSDARAQLDEGHSQLADAGQELQEGRETLDDNTEKLMDNLETLADYTAAQERVQNGSELLMTVPSIRRLLGTDASHSEVFAASENYYTTLSAQLREEQAWAIWTFLALMLAGALALLTVLFSMIGNHWNITTIACVLSALFGIAGLLLWKIFSSKQAVMMIPVIAMCIIAIIASELLSKLRPKKGKHLSR